MSQLVPFLNFGFEDSQSAECDMFYYSKDPIDNAKMVSAQMYTESDGNAERDNARR